MSRLILIALMLLGLLAQPVTAADEIIRERMTIPAGSTSVSAKGTVKGYNSFEYQVAALSGQTMAVKLDAANKSTYFNVWAPGKKPGQDEALYAGAISGDVFSQRLEEAGDYMVQVYLYRNAARRNETSDFTLTVQVNSEPEPQEPSDDFADGLTGGPDFWVVSDVAADDELNIRKGASTKDTIVKGVPNGAILRNKGCKMVDGQRWCAVEDRYDPAVAGWAAGRYLREAGAQAQENASSDALVPGTNYHATGRIPCTLDGQPDVKDCEFGVTRGVPGVATIFITLPNGFVRVLSFDDGKVSPQSAVTSFDSSREDDNTRVKVNGSDENYLIPDAVINGG